ncbi:hypothetical protein SAMN04489740_4079 [Arthrobacter alpinus]|uniref:Uncharacterized protein n=1 Tax=Arthrobacter alpinus TaxID=656366 RepID=A0A1H5PDV8_9MICC|nr:hypothetical protein [Arthrobacter alpinus]SEF11211.1 hypothetical protein SAMN04489740_4079 [Arthrobacter alpinus]
MYTNEEAQAIIQACRTATIDRDSAALALAKTTVKYMAAMDANDIEEARHQFRLMSGLRKDYVESERVMRTAFAMNDKLIAQF